MNEWDNVQRNSKKTTVWSLTGIIQIFLVLVMLSVVICVKFIKWNFSCWTVYKTLRISMILYKTFLLGVGGLNLNCCLVIIQLLSFFMLVVSRFIRSLCFVFLCACFSLSYACICHSYILSYLCFLLRYAVNKDLYKSELTAVWAELRGMRCHQWSWSRCCSSAWKHNFRFPYHRTFPSHFRFRRRPTDIERTRPSSA